MNSEQSGAPTNLLDGIQKIVTLLGSISAVAVATGLPAVYVQYSNMGIPTSFITNEQIFRAGIAPAALFFVFGAYALLVISKIEMGQSAPSALIVGGPLFIVPVASMIILFIGLGAILIWSWWWTINLLFMLVKLFGFEPARRVHLWLATGCAVLNLVVPFVANLSSRKVEQVKEHVKEQRHSQTSRGWFFCKTTIVLSGGLLLGLFAIRWYLEELELPLGVLAESKQIIIFVIIATSSLAAFFSFALIWRSPPQEDHVMRLLFTSLNIFLVAVIFVFSVWWYSSMLYPRIPAALGGGKPEAVVVWLGASDLPLEFWTALKGADCQAIASTVRCSHLQLINRNDKDVILAILGDNASAAVLVSRDAMRAVSW